ncbi:MAG TPA: hypothetical protein VK960_07625 [Acidimicrobiia bacterium]|nr:hypothetical protein [Acidimicrobiia bacterium]
MHDDTPRPYHPDSGVTLLGPFLTAAQVTERTGRAPTAFRGPLLKISCRLGAGCAYPAFQFDHRGQCPEVAFLAPILIRRVGHEAACDWLVRPHGALEFLSPIDWLHRDRDIHRVIGALPDPTRPLPGTLEVTEAEILAFERRQPWIPEPYLARAA